jgi:hypothetical protein
MPEGRIAMQPRWHDPQPMAMVQHGGRSKLPQSAPVEEVGETAPSEPIGGAPARETPARTAD